jgi:4-hydroxy-tetrahydrodipicolinate synthase
MFKGSFPALITPFKNGEVDEDSFRAFVEWQIEEGTDGLVPCGTTGESPTLSHDEHKRVTEICIEQAKGRVPVIAGAGSNSTREAVELTEHAKEAGADAALVVTPYYNKPTQKGLYEHFKAVQDVGLPVFIYNIPGRSVVDMTVATMAELAKLPNIVGVKDATANIAPRMCADMQRAWREGDLETCMTLQDRLMPVHSAMFCETSPGPVKYAASLLGKCRDEMRLPMAEIADKSKETVRAALVGVGLLN